MLYPANGMQKENKEFIRDKKALAGEEMQVITLSDTGELS